VKKIVLTSHAQDRVDERSISRSEITETIRDPDITSPTRHRRRRRLMKTLNNRTIDVIIEERDKIILVVTCAVLNKEA
jgi:hypothetical protein